VNMTVNGVQGLTEIDTGAGVTILNEETFKLVQQGQSRVVQHVAK